MSSNNSAASGAADFSKVNPEQIFSITVLRGLALFGILFISIWEFGGFTSNEQTFYRTGPHGGNYILLTIVSILFEGKMNALFALVFGAGIFLFVKKKEHPVTMSTADAYIRSLLWLIGFGLVNAFILLWPRDILFQYGVVGIILFAFSGIKSKGLFVAAMLCTFIYCGKQYWNYADDKNDHKNYMAVTALEKKFKQDSIARSQKDSLSRNGDTVLLKETIIQNKRTDSLAKKKDTLTKKQSQEKEKWEGLVKEMKFDSSKTKSTNKAMRDSYGNMWKQVMQKSQSNESFWLYKIGIWEIGSLMLLGMALMSIGFFSSRFSSSKYIVIALLSILVGFALAWFRIKFNDARLSGYELYIEKKAIPFNLFYPIENILLAIGYASLVLGLLRLKLLNWLWRAFSATGQMALTNYILQSVICTFFFYGYGFGYFERLNQVELYFLVLEIILAQVVFSVLWLRYYNRGPLEWLWLCLTYRQWLTIKKQAIK